MKRAASRTALAAALLMSGAIALAADSGSTKPAARDLPALYAILEKTDVIVEGATSPKRVLYVFLDANCWYCHLTWKALQPYERAGLQVRWVPVAYQKDSSVGRAAALMQARDRAAALRQNEQEYRPQSYDGGIAPAAKVSASLVAQFEANEKVMERLGAQGTPALVWKDGTGNVRVRVGMPRLSQLPAITGLPEQKIDDPELAEFK